MKAIREAAGQDLQWSSKKGGLFAEDEFELQSGNAASSRFLKWFLCPCR